MSDRSKVQQRDKKSHERARAEARTKKRVKRPAENTTLVAALGAAAFSLLGLDTEVTTAAVTGGVGAIPLAVSKLVDWYRRHDDEREQKRELIEEERNKRYELLERGVVALEMLVRGDEKQPPIDAADLVPAEEPKTNGAPKEESGADLVSAATNGGRH